MDIDEELKIIKLRFDAHEEILLSLTNALFDLLKNNTSDNNFKEILELQHKTAIKAFDILKTEFNK